MPTPRHVRALLLAIVVSSHVARADDPEAATTQSVSACGRGHKTIFVDLGNNPFRDPDYTGQTRNARPAEASRVGGNINTGDWIVGCIDEGGKFVEETILSGESVRVVLLNPRAEYSYSLLQDGGTLKPSDSVVRKSLDATGPLCTPAMPECDRDADELDKLQRFLGQYAVEIPARVTTDQAAVARVSLCGAAGWVGCVVSASLEPETAGTSARPAKPKPGAVGGANVVRAVQAIGSRPQLKLAASVSGATPEVATLYAGFLRTRATYERRLKELCAKWKDKYTAFELSEKFAEDDGKDIASKITTWSRAKTRELTRYSGIKGLIATFAKGEDDALPDGIEDAQSWYYWRTNYRRYSCAGILGTPDEDPPLQLAKNGSSPPQGGAAGEPAKAPKTPAPAATDAAPKKEPSVVQAEPGGTPAPPAAPAPPAQPPPLAPPGPGEHANALLLDARLTSAFFQYRRAARLIDHAQSARVLSLAPQEGNSRAIVTILAEPNGDTVPPAEDAPGLPAVVKVAALQNRVVELENKPEAKAQAYQFAYDVRPSDTFTASVGYAVPFYRKRGESKAMSGPLTPTGFIHGRVATNRKYLRHVGGGLGFSLDAVREVVSGNDPPIPDLMVGAFAWPIEEVSLGTGLAYAPDNSRHAHLGWFFTASADIPALVRLARGVQNVLAR
jgi:hypothetical protein